ncbi:TetR/AcrR family transcriptional regulator [Clostridium bowmanii]|uniref:TetR/AcrR family transcriptional regulator n=1 Tax=Clostridium bowmanii TaxID=132925 RepID=UPI001C0DE1FE|nr:TetR/AcrR family transcriptional regulator [Clostridium bowmanii]MBU3189647.1 TetR/AcrR family transcriptional regulator [Clostridium bowmanii]MCA1073507.1 TetR/AcrR family transcriptional regulator [Clostridium bowmanii]
MDLKVKRKLEMDNQKKKRKEEVVLAAIVVFKERGIDNSKMTDIADRAEIGVATVYRYFNTKTEIVIAATAIMWEEKISILYGKFGESIFMELNGADRVREILNLFINVYQKYPEFLSFLEHFDNYIVKEAIPLENLVSYEKIIIDTKSAIFDAIDQGKKDGSIKSNIDNDAFYITITHSLMSLCQKLILRGTILKSDKDIGGEIQLKLLIDMAMLYLVS